MLYAFWSYWEHIKLQIVQHSELLSYIDFISLKWFEDSPLKPIPASLIDEAKQQHFRNKNKNNSREKSNGGSDRKGSNDEMQFNKYSTYWLLMSLAAMIGYGLTTLDLSGMIVVDDENDMDMEDDDDDDDDDEGGF